MVGLDNSSFRQLLFFVSYFVFWNVNKWLLVFMGVVRCAIQCRKNFCSPWKMPELHRCFVSSFYDLYGIPGNQILLCPADKLPFVKKMKRKGFTHRDISIGMFRVEKTNVFKMAGWYLNTNIHIFRLACILPT